MKQLFLLTVLVGITIVISNAGVIVPTSHQKYPPGNLEDPSGSLGDSFGPLVNYSSDRKLQRHKRLDLNFYGSYRETNYVACAVCIGSVSVFGNNNNGNGGYHRYGRGRRYRSYWG